MKKYLQACETGGSIYGKKHATGKKGGFRNKRAGKEGLMNSCNRLYKNQVAAMEKVFRRDR